MMKAQVAMRATLLVGSMFLASAHSLEASVLCKKKNAVVVARDTCKPNEVMLTTPTGPQGPAGTTGATGATGPQGPQGSGGPQVVDSAGHLVGALLPGLPDDCNVLRLQGDGTAIGLHFGDGPEACGSLFLYETPNCTGTPYLDAFLGNVRGTGYQYDAATGQYLVYYANGTLLQRTILSASYTLGSSCQTGIGPSAVLVGQATRLDLSGFTPPFGIR